MPYGIWKGFFALLHSSDLACPLNGMIYYIKHWSFRKYWFTELCRYSKCWYNLWRYCSCSVTKLCLILCDPVDWSMLGFPVLNYLQSLLKFMSIESVMPSNYLIFSLPLLFLPSIFPNIRVFSKESALSIIWPKYWASASTSVLPVNIQGWFPLGLTGLLSLLSKGHSRVISSTTIWKYQFFSTQPSLWSNSHIHTWHLMTQYWKIILVASTMYLIREDLE